MKPGDRVQLHPACDEWMQGDRYGAVVSVKRTRTGQRKLRIVVKLDVSGRVRSFPEDLVLTVQ